MPTYEYKCKQCKHTMEEVQSMKDDPLVECPVCHTPNLVRLIGNGSGLIFKGKGFYQTDYKKSNSVSTSSGGARPKEESAQSDSATSDTPKSGSTTTDGATSSGTDSSSAKNETGSGSTTKSE
jgi:putative FmdB family regulatory protein